MAARRNPANWGENTEAGATGSNPWRDTPILPTAKEQAGLPWMFRTPVFSIWVAGAVGLIQLGLWRVFSSSNFNFGESQYFGFVSQASIEISILVLTLTPAMAAVLLAATTRQERGLAFLSSQPLFYRGIWRLFSPMIPAVMTLFLAFLVEPIQTDLNNAAVSGFLGTVLFGFVFLQVNLVVHSMMSVRSQIADQGKDTAEELLKLVREGKAHIVSKDSAEPPAG